MPTEERYVKFTFNEIYNAINEYATNQGQMTIPNGTIQSIALNPNDGKQTVLCTVLNEQGDTQDVKLEQKFFVLSLVHACQNDEIPLPKAARKLLSFTPNMLIMKIDFENAPISATQ